MLALLILAGVVYLARAPLLHGLASFLVVDEPVRAVDALVLLDGENLYERAAELYQAGTARRILIFQGSPNRLIRLEILEEPSTRAARELERLDVPKSSVEVLKMEKSGDWRRARRLRDWLQEHPAAQVCVLCDRFSSRRTRALFGQELGALAERVHWRALPDSRYDETNWQRDKAGILDLFAAYVSCVHVSLYGNSLGEQDEWDPDAYQESLP